MARTYAEELVYIHSEDGILLEGAVVRPVNRPAKPSCVVWVHGSMGRFEEPFVITVGRQLATRGITFLTGNNRGHHIGAQLKRKSGEVLIGGGWWELIDEAPLDIAAWITFAVNLGFPSVVLAGHSLGTLKVTYYQTHRSDPRVCALILSSPPPRISAMLGKTNPELTKLAEQMVEEGSGNALLPWGSLPGGRTQSAQTFLAYNRMNTDVFGVQAKPAAIASVQHPILVCLGTNDTLVTLADAELIQRNATGSPRCDIRVIEGGDHQYTGHEEQAGVAIGEWLETLET